MKKYLKTKLMRKQIILFFFLYPMIGIAQRNYEKQIREISNELSKKIIGTGKKRIAVVDFTDNEGIRTKLGKFIAEEFNTYLPELSKDFVIIDRSHVNLLIEENQMLKKGLTEPTNAIKLGRLAGIDALIYGTVSPFGNGIKINTKILDLQKGTIIDSSVGNISRTSEIIKLMNESNTDDSGISDADSKSKYIQSRDVDCARFHKGVCLIKNTLSHDIRIKIMDLENFQDLNKPYTIINKIIKAKDQEILSGMYAGINGSRIIELEVYKNPEISYPYETYQLHIVECKIEVLYIK